MTSKSHSPLATREPINVDGQPTVISILSTAELAASPFLPLLPPVMNTAYRASHVRGPVEYLPLSVVRLRTDTQILDEIGPEAFTVLVSTAAGNPDGPKVYASASAKLFTGLAAPETTDEVVRTFKRTALVEPLDPDIEQWELLLMAVDVSLQGQGIAGKLLGMVEDEIRRRTSGKGREVHIILSTLKERNFEYYVKKGFVWTAEKKFKKGQYGSQDGFTLVEMMKKVE
ncbi:hypothetical protein MMC30_001904 [Trapelia coarctata]|nr:hypothetical protein [Trapelia coarctata]